MHKYLRAVGFSNFKKKDLEIVVDNVIEKPDTIKVTKDSEGNEFVELTKMYDRKIGIAICGSYDEEDNFHMDYYFPFSISDEVSTLERIDIDKHADKESYAGICDEIRLGVTLIFFLQNVADFLSEHHNNIHVKGLRGAFLSGLSVDGKIILPIKENDLDKKVLVQKKDKRNRLVAEAREGNEAAIETLALEDMDTYNSIAKRVRNEDIFSIVKTSFMPYGIESDHYSILGIIVEVEEFENSLTNEIVYSMKLNCNDIYMDVTINKKDLEGEPAIGRRFKGSVWMQGTVCLENMHL